MKAFQDAANGNDPTPMMKWLMSEESSSEDGVAIRLLQCRLRGNFGNHSLACCRALLRYDSDGIAYDSLKEENFYLDGHVFTGNVESVAFFLATGADANGPHGALFELAGTVRPSVEVLKLLLRAGALWDSYRWDARDYGIAESGWFCSDWSPVYRAGEHVGPDYRTLEQRLRLALATAGPFGNGLDESRYNECISLLAAVREAGSWKGYVNAVVIAPQKELLTLRTLCFRGRARPPPELARLFDPAVPNDVVWVVLQFWAIAH
jgi:hypothetical protein